jgi:hypothetical protein
MDEVKVLGDNVSAWTRKIESISFLTSSEIMQFKSQVSRKLFFVTPDYPSKTRIDKSKFVSGSVIRMA